MAQQQHNHSVQQQQQEKRSMTVEVKSFSVERSYPEQIGDELTSIMQGGAATRLRELAANPPQVQGHLDRMERLKRAAEAAYLAAQEAVNQCP